MSDQLEFGRSRPAADTYALVEPHFARLGISRVARQTGLDRVGLPCFAAIRPNSRSLAAHYGKGLTDDAARTAAVMEALEFAVAEDPSATQRVASMRDLAAEGCEVFDCRRLLPPGATLDPDLEMIWIEAAHLADGRPILVPADAVTLGDLIPRLTEVAKTTNGLASGNDDEEATLHGLCELIERDGLTLWSLRSIEHAQTLAFQPASLGSTTVDALERQLSRAGLQLRLYDVTTDIGVPVVHAVIRELSNGNQRLFSAAAGTGCHPDPRRAAVSAIAEAAQSRLTNIAGSRDDFSPGEYETAMPVDLEQLLDSPVTPRDPPAGLITAREPRAAAQLEEMFHRLAAVGIDDIVVARLGGEDLGLAVVRVLSNRLEDCFGNANWWPAGRALRASAGGRA